MYGSPAFKFYFVALNCLLYSLITFFGEGKKKKKKIFLNFPKAQPFLRIHQEKQLSFCTLLICLDIASQWIIHLVLEFKNPHNANLCVTT